MKSILFVKILIITLPLVIGITKINKCCEINEIMVDSRCSHVNYTDSIKWTPVFTSENGIDNVQVPDYQFVIGKPACASTQRWPVKQYPSSQDKLILLPNGKLRHYIHLEKFLESIAEYERKQQYGSINAPIPELEKDVENLFFDYEQGKYCMDKLEFSNSKEAALFALVCAPKVGTKWSQMDFFIFKILNPLFHIIGIICFLIVAIIYFVLPTLRDLNGNIITTINMCLIVTQAADAVRIFSEYSTPLNFWIADFVIYLSLLGAFFWLNSLGYYIWKTFKSRNVFLRVTDGRKYCYYTCYAWSATLLMGGLALFAHFVLDTGNSKRKIGKHFANSFITNSEQEIIGWLGTAIFFTPIAFTVIINIFFYVTTLKVINRMNTYGRIHHKLKHNFNMFFLMFIIMTICWLFFMLSTIHYEGFMYAHIIVNALQGPLLLYICVIRQAHVMFLLRKSCCYNEPVPTNDWGDEMTQMNGSY